MAVAALPFGLFDTQAAMETAFNIQNYQRLQ